MSGLLSRLNHQVAQTGARPESPGSPPPGPAAPQFDTERMADAVHATLCVPFATIDPKECVHGRQRDVWLAAALIAKYERLGL